MFRLVQYVLPLLMVYSIADKVFAQKAKFNFYTGNDGIVGAFVRGVSQDHEGFIWLISDGKLQRFDGQNFVAECSDALVSENPADGGGPNDVGSGDFCCGVLYLSGMVCATAVFIFSGSFCSWPDGLGAPGF